MKIGIKRRDYPYALEFVPECYKTQKMCDKALDIYPSTIKLVPVCYKAQEMCHRTVHRCFSVFDLYS